MARTTGGQLDREFAGLGKQLERLSLQARATRDFLRKALQPVARDARKLIPKPGYPGDKPEFKPLRNTIRVAVRDYGRTWYGAVGPAYPAGAHGHLVAGFRRPARHHARGRPTGKSLRVTPFLGPAYRKHQARLMADLAQFAGRQIKGTARG